MIRSSGTKEEGGKYWTHIHIPVSYDVVVLIVIITIGIISLECFYITCHTVEEKLNVCISDTLEVKRSFPQY